MGARSLSDFPESSSKTHRMPPWVEAVAACVELGKPRLILMVVITTATGYVLALPEVSGALVGGVWRLLLTLAGTGLAGLGANALNEWVELRRDERMQRTAARPLPTGRLSPTVALAFGLAAGVAGPLLLAAMVNLAAAGLALLTLLIYVALYTPLKQRTPTNTLVGAIVGAIPPLIGWVAATGGVAVGGWILAAILFVWQIPHFLALAWMLRDDYARGGFRMLPGIDLPGHLTACLIVIYTLGLLPVSLMLTLVGLCGWTYAIGALLLGGGLLALAIALERRPSASAARRVFLGTLGYLPLLMALMLADKFGWLP